jgi:hypothetical protein
MIKKLSDLNKEEKILLIQALAAGQIDKDCMNDDTLICIEKEDMFLGFLMSGSQFEQYSQSNVICIGDARRAKKALFDNILSPTSTLNS